MRLGDITLHRIFRKSSPLIMLTALPDALKAEDMMYLGSALGSRSANFSLLRKVSNIDLNL